MDSEASSRAERGRGYVILFSNEPRCCYVATSERRRIRLKADFHYFALRGASIRRSQRSNSEAVLFLWTLPRRYSIRRSRWDNTLTITLHQHYLRLFIFLLFVHYNQPINNVIFHYIKKHCKNSCLNCVNIVKYIRLSGRKLAKCKNISNLAYT